MVTPAARRAPAAIGRPRAGCRAGGARSPSAARRARPPPRRPVARPRAPRGRRAGAQVLGAGGRLGRGGQLAVAAVRGLAGDAERAGDRAVGASALQRPPRLDALERVELAAQRRERAQGDLGLRGPDRVLDQFDERGVGGLPGAPSHVHRDRDPGEGAPGGPARNAITSATSAGSISRLTACGARMTSSSACSSLIPWPRPGRQLALDQRRADVAGADGGGGDAGLGAFQRERLDQPEDAVLGGDVGGLVRRGDERVDGGDGDEAPLARLPRARPGVLGQQERARQQQREDRVPAVLGELRDGRDVLDAGVGDDDSRRPNASTAADTALALPSRVVRSAMCPARRAGRRRGRRNRRR